MMDGVEYLCIAVRNIYVAAGMKNRDFERVVTFFETLYASNRLALPLKGILIIGYWKNKAGDLIAWLLFGYFIKF